MSHDHWHCHQSHLTGAGLIILRRVDSSPQAEVPRLRLARRSLRKLRGATNALLSAGAAPCPTHAPHARPARSRAPFPRGAKPHAFRRKSYRSTSSDSLFLSMASSSNPITPPRVSARVAMRRRCRARAASAARGRQLRRGERQSTPSLSREGRAPQGVLTPRRAFQRLHVSRLLLLPPAAACLCCTVLPV